ncbi:hypothetical protein [Streptomyces chilikensis]|uniref:hypothetical protein n=1 Tax=Streptomyces chilikensis TaxID=1194079 RepID=UPI000AE6FD64|nr:hypothetical protein [Streptomyces chilikensis]
MIPARFARSVGETIKSLTETDREQVRAAVERACADPWSWPRAGKDDFDDEVRVITTSAVIVHYVIIPGPAPHLWVFAITA